MVSLPALFGFTSEPQDMSSGLTYLRARYYHPALGRFLTQDSLIPDVTNGQALNAYTYVYNDPINLVDPSGNIPEGLGTALDTIGQAGNNLRDWWHATPDECDSSCAKGWTHIVAPYATLGPQAAWAYVSEPAQRHGTKVVEKLKIEQFKRVLPLRWLKNARLIRKHMPTIHLVMQAFMPNEVHLWTKTTRTWVEVNRITGPLNQIQPHGPRLNKTYYNANGTGRYTLNTRLRPLWGWKGLVGTPILGGVIDGIFQLYGDLSLICLSMAQRANRAGLAFLLGTAAGVVGTAAFVAAAGLFAPGLAAATVGFVFAYATGKFLEKHKENWFAKRPDLFGH